VSSAQALHTVSWTGRVSWRSKAVAGGVLVSALLTIVVLCWPLLFTSTGVDGDWEHHLWFIWQQSLAIRADHAPSMFINTTYSAFYPQYAFYGGTIYALAGTLSLALGDSPLRAYVLTYLLGFAAAYGGWYWIARSLGVGRWLAQAPALLFVSSPYYLTLIYGRGDWPEFIALSTLPLMCAAGLSVIGDERLRTLPAAILTGSAIVFFGSHAITILWGSTLLGLTCIVLVACVPEVRRSVRGRRVIVAGALVTAALLVNAWYLLPAVAYASHTLIGSHYDVARELLRSAMPFVSLHHLFTLSRATSVAGLPDFVLALPTLAIAWTLVGVAAVVRRTRGGPWVRTLLLIGAVTAALIVLMTHAGLLLALPGPYSLLQYSYRLEGFILMGVAAAATVILARMRSGSRRVQLWAWTIVPILIVSAVAAIQQVGAYPVTHYARDYVLAKRGEQFGATNVDYGYFPLPYVSEAGLAKLVLTPEEIHDNHASLTVHAPPGQLIATNIGGGPDLVHITGASIVGADALQQLVLAVGGDASARSGTARAPASSERITVGPAQGTAVVLGRALTLAGVAMLAAASLLTLAVRRLHGRRP